MYTLYCPTCYSRFTHIGDAIRHAWDACHAWELLHIGHWNTPREVAS